MTNPQTIIGPHQSPTESPITRSSLHDEVVERLRDMIVSGQIVEGERIREKQLCEGMGVSRTPLREALKVLGSEGLLELLPNRGARVVQLSLADFEEMFEIMAALEGLAGEIACRQIKDHEIEEIKWLQYGMEKFYDNGEMLELFKIDQNIHLKIIESTQNGTLINIYRSLAARMRRARFMGARRDHAQLSLMKDHTRMIDALTERNGAQLSRIMQRHVQKKCEVVRSLFSKAAAHS